MLPSTPTAPRPDRWPLVLMAVAVLSAWTLYAGKDVGWDLFNHHLYLPFSLLSGRFETDLFAAGPQSYQNPLGYVPFYLLAMSGLPAWAVGLALAGCVTALCAWSVHHVSLQVLGDEPQDRDWRRMAFAMALCAPVFLMVVGTSSTDPVCAALLMFTVAIALDAQAGQRTALLAGVAMGLAVAIKPTMVIFAVPAGGLMAAQVLGRTWTPTRMLSAWIASLVAFALAAGPWAWWLWKDYGNPTFPLFNQIFQSPLAPQGPVVALRFLPETGWDWLVRPWHLALFRPFTAAEAFVPDLRPLAAIAATLAASIMATRRHGTRVWLTGRTWLRADVQLALFLAVTYGLWMATSGNARYAIPWFLLMGVLLVRAVHCAANRRWALVGLGALLGVQLVGYVAAGDHRLLLTQRWDSRAYVTTKVPQRLRDQPHLHLSIGFQSYAGIAPFLHPSGAFINVKGQMSLPTDGALGDRLQQHLRAWKGRTRFLFEPPVRPDSPKLAHVIAAENWAQTHRLGLKIDPADCEVIQFLPPAPGSPPRPAGRRSETLELLSCAALEERRPDTALDQRLAEADRVFDLLETRCPRIYGPRPMVSDYGPQITWRHYLNSDAKIEISQGEGVVLSHFRSPNPVFLGPAEHVISNGGQDACTAWKQLSKM